MARGTRHPHTCHVERSETSSTTTAGPCHSTRRMVRFLAALEMTREPPVPGIAHGTRHPPLSWRAERAILILVMSSGARHLQQWPPDLGMARATRRMPIEPSCRDVTRLPGMTRRMYKQQHRMEQMLALWLSVSPGARLIGAGLRDSLDGDSIRGAETIPDEERIPGGGQRNKVQQWRRSSGVCVLLRQRWRISPHAQRQIIGNAPEAFATLVLPPVPTHVRT